jgi:capsular polysaccharide export protein
VSYRGRYTRWRDWIGRYLEREQVTDVLYYADRLPYHADTLDAARALGVRCWAIEFGYLRPDWITMEPEAMGAYSTFPKSPKDIEALAQDMPSPDMTVLYPYDFFTEAVNEVSFHLLQAFGRPFYPLYNSDKPYWPLVDYGSWIGELAFERRRKREAADLEAAISAGEFDYNLVAMQIQADYQIRASSPYDHISDFLAEVFASFKRGAPASRELVVKLHPLDNGLERWFARVPKLAREAGLEGRVHIVKGGDLVHFLKASKGVALINSTVGIHALRMAVPTFAAGEAVFDVPGLTHQGDLDTFWTKPDPVDQTFFKVFIRALSTIQIKGSFYNRDGRKAAIAEIGRRLGRPAASGILDDEAAVT